ncbi:TPR-16 domain containing protein [Pyrenophora tritici-repentis]|uniref:TPR-16 domain containing protein n=2 Tax=Pyrenophora tritici-repentis TaxID=45151 RepID=A0A2W1FQQ1_9PLEO|nr:TPR-16 domain-containing protein [Pyrenophora tritici-repentis]KAF7444019.1 TPR-16 domain containing protein [Pyrenophora tritici-repentis]KAG9379757.1 TPR-16 domain containing protein [Pyrenophora tritici-repentis]KAI0576672.1 TPR-16 domain-containing protein [Pyrenophora tritici-repentis]KAI0580493.1 TPR-16 domain-containing protein [Pyrenophora tritici-repentis]
MQAPSRGGHSRVVSGDERRRTALVRRTTKGPLDDDIVDDPLAESAPTQPSRIRSPVRAEASQQPHNGPTRGIDDMPSKDFSFLQDPQAYHVLSVTNVPPPFLNAPHAPPVSSPIDSLLLSGHYRLAAVAAARNLVSAAPGDHDTLFHLVHIRLACLCLLQEHALAAQEAKVLGDLNSAFYRHPLTNAHLVPWDLRLLVVRLAALGYGEWRKGIMGYYELARECRENILRRPDDEKPMWRSRLRDCGIRVANVLVEMGDLEGAGRHLGTLVADGEQSREISIMETLVWLRVGDMQSARRCLARASEVSPDELVDDTLRALVQLADADYPAATASFEALREKFPEDAMVAQNLAVCLLYTGRISDAANILSELVDQSPPFHSLVLNLSTVYELCTEKNRDKKLALAEKMASRKGGDGVGWELSNAEFKL